MGNENGMMARGLICKFVWYALPSKNEIERRRVVEEGKKIDKAFG